MNTDVSLYDQNKASVATTSSYSYYEPIGNEQELFQQDCDMEDVCYAQYDYEMANAVAEADYQDCYYEQQLQQIQQSQEVEEYFDDEEDAYYSDEKPQQSYDYQHDSLLSLIVGVQSYLTEQEQYASSNDSPLYGLQYKMYTYMRQRALELGVQL